MHSGYKNHFQTPRFSRSIVLPFNSENSGIYIVYTTLFV